MEQETPVSGFITSDDGTRLAYRLDGPTRAPALVLVNSLGADLRLWGPQIAALSASFHIVRYDTRGHGRSDAPAGPYTIDRLGLDLLALLDRLDLASAHLCGISLGGLTVQWVAAHRPGRVGHVVLANTASRIGTAEGWQARIDAVRAGGMAAVREAVVTRFLSAGFRAAHPRETHAVGAMLQDTDPTGYMAACAALRDTDLSAVTPSIDRPALIVAGASDEATPPAQSEELRAAIAGSVVQVLPRTGHLSNVEQPAVFNALLLDFLAPGTAHFPDEMIH